MYNVNCGGVFLTARACARQMIRYQCPGSVVLVGSMSGLNANKGFHSVIYNSSKAGVIQMARNLAMEVCTSLFVISAVVAALAWVSRLRVTHHTSPLTPHTEPYTLHFTPCT